MRGPGAGEAFGFGFYHRSKVISAQCALLLQVSSDGLQLVI
jgi:hypothetical protein